MSPGVATSTSSRIRSLYSAVKVRRFGLATTSGSNTGLGRAQMAPAAASPCSLHSLVGASADPIWAHGGSWETSSSPRTAMDVPADLISCIFLSSDIRFHLSALLYLRGGEMSQASWQRGDSNQARANRNKPERTEPRDFDRNKRKLKPHQTPANQRPVMAFRGRGFDIRQRVALTGPVSVSRII